MEFIGSMVALKSLDRLFDLAAFKRIPSSPTRNHFTKERIENDQSYAYFGIYSLNEISLYKANSLRAFVEIEHHTFTYSRIMGPKTWDV
jgi:hypothetical protein